MESLQWKVLYNLTETIEYCNLKNLKLKLEFSMFRKVRVREDAGGVRCLLRSPQVADQASWAIHLNLTKYSIFSGKIY